MRKSGKKGTGGGRKPTRIAPGFGRALYEATVRQRNEDGTAWSLGDLAKRMGTSRNTVTRWLAMEKPPRGPTLRGLAQCLGISPAALGSDASTEIYLINLDPWMQEAIRRADAERNAARQVPPGLPCSLTFDGP